MPTSTTTRHSLVVRVARGFTLVEVMVGATLGAFVLVGVLSTYLHLIRSGIRATQYAEMETQVRRGFEQLGHDLKIASGITWNSASNLTLTVPDSSGATTQVTYAWDSTAQSFFCVPGASNSATAGRIDLVRGIPPAGRRQRRPDVRPVRPRRSGGHHRPGDQTHRDQHDGQPPGRDDGGGDGERGGDLFCHAQQTNPMMPPFPSTGPTPRRRLSEERGGLLITALLLAAAIALGLAGYLSTQL